MSVPVGCRAQWFPTRTRSRGEAGRIGVVCAPPCRPEPQGSDVGQLPGMDPLQPRRCGSSLTSQAWILSNLTMISTMTQSHSFYNEILTSHSKLSATYKIISDHDYEQRAHDDSGARREGKLLERKTHRIASSIFTAPVTASWNTKGNHCCALGLDLPVAGAVQCAQADHLSCSCVNRLPVSSDASPLQYSPSFL